MRADRRLPTPLAAGLGHFRAAAPRAIWVPTLIGFIAAEGVIRHLEAKFAIPRFPVPVRPGTVFLYCAAVLLGASRAIVFHPRLDGHYRKWLSRTPWTADKPLPRGPIALSWFDGLTLGGLFLAALFAPDVSPIQIINAFTIVYFLAVVGLTLATGVLVPAYLALFTMGFMPRFWMEPWISCAFGVISYLVVYWGIRRSLKTFPWSTAEEGGPLPRGVVRALDGKGSHNLGWPYERLLIEPEESPNHQSLATHSLIACLLLAWWISCVSVHVTAPPAEFLVGMRIIGFTVAAFGSMFRLAAYVAGYLPPISLAGRITARRLIIPGYDQAFLVFPLLFLAPESVSQIGEALGLSPMVYAPIIPPLVLFIALATPPGLRQWRLTGRHRMVAAISAQDRNYAKVG